MVKTLGFCELIVKRPKLCFGLALGAHVAVMVVTAILNVAGYDILPVEFGQIPLDLQKDPTKLQADAWNFVARDPRITINPSTLGLHGERSAKFDILEVVYELKDGNVFTRENLKLIQETEKELFENKVYQDKMCLLEQNGSCKPPLSVVRFFDGSYGHFSPVFNDLNFEKITNVLSTAYRINKTRSILDYHLAKGAVITTNEATSHYTRSLLYVGYPFAGFKNTDDRSEEQWELLQKHSGDAFGNTIDRIYKSGVGKMNFFYYLRSLFFDAISKQVSLDLLLVFGSFTFIFVFVLFQTQSLWITGWAIFSIFACFFSANLIYRVVLDYRYIGTFHVLSVFIILGIGADDVFVFMDTWRASEGNKKYENFVSRFSDVYRHAAGAMFVTSFTTMVAFLVNVSSPILAVSSFGTFSALLVFVNYCSVVVFFPTVLVTHELYWKDWKWPCFKPCSRTNQVISVIHENSAVENDSSSNNNNNNNNNNVERNGSSSNNGNEDEDEANKVTLKVSRFFKGVFCDYVITHKAIRWVVLIVFSGFLILTITYATHVKVAEEQVDIWGPGTNWYSIERLRGSVFKPSKEDNVIDLHLVWGLKNQDRSSCHFTDFKCTGQTVLDRSFDMNSAPCQVAMMDFCSRLKNLPEPKLRELRIRSDALSGIPEVHCYIEELNKFLKEETQKSKKYPNETDLSLPVNSRKIKALVRYNSNLYNVTGLTDVYYRYFEVALGYWLTHGNTSYSSDDYVMYKELLGGEMDPTDSSGKPNFQGGKYGNSLLYQAVVVRTSMRMGSLGYQDGLKTYDKWEEYMREEMKRMPVSCANAFQTAPVGFAAWHWLKVQQVLVDSAVRGIILGFCLCLPLLILMNTNWIVSTLCVLTIACITVGVVGIIPLVGWKLGVLESLNLTLVVGLAVDYVVHLADGYVRSQHHYRHEKVRDTLGHVGISVLSGACTTLGASVFMLAGKILFFFQFGIFMFCTIGLSILYALFFFTTLLGLVGPEGNTGSIKPLIKFIKDWISGKKSGAVDCDKCHGKGFHDPVVIRGDVNLETH